MLPLLADVGEDNPPLARTVALIGGPAIAVIELIVAVLGPWGGVWITVTFETLLDRFVAWTGGPTTAEAGWLLFGSVFDETATPSQVNPFTSSSCQYAEAQVWTEPAMPRHWPSKWYAKVH